MHLLLSDVQKEARSVPATVLSVVLHGGLVVILAISGQQVVSTVRALIEETVLYLYPVERAVGAERPGERIEAGGIRMGAVGSGQRTADGTGGAGSSTSVAHKGVLFPLPLEGDADAPGTADGAFSLLEVDSAAVRDPTSGAPDYPEALAQRQVEGGAVLRFVVDSTGTVDMATVRVISATHSLFARAVLEALPRMRYRPARIGDHAVRLLVEQSFTFKIQRPKTNVG